MIDHLPQRVAVLDMNEADFLDQLNVPIMGMPKDYVPHFLEKYKKMHKFRIWVQLYSQYGKDICIKARPDFDDAITR